MARIKWSRHANCSCIALVHRTSANCFFNLVHNSCTTYAAGCMSAHSKHGARLALHKYQFYSLPPPLFIPQLEHARPARGTVCGGQTRKMPRRQLIKGCRGVFVRSYDDDPEIFQKHQKTRGRISDRKIPGVRIETGAPR